MLSRIASFVSPMPLEQPRYARRPCAITSFFSHCSHPLTSGQLSATISMWTFVHISVSHRNIIVNIKECIMSNRPAIVAEGLHKHYGKTHALDGLDLVAEQGSVLGLLGPNGAGKTTAVRILTTLLRPDAGRAEVAGLDVVKNADTLRAHIGLAGQYAAVDENLTGYETLVMFGQLYHLSGSVARQRAAQLLANFELVDAGARTVKTYSGGMRRRLDLAASLIIAPP